MKEEEISKIIEKQIVKIEKLDIKIHELDNQYEAIKSVSPLCQLSPISENILDKMAKLSRKKAKIWNYLRHYGIAGTGETLWQLAVASKKTAVNRHGEENHLDFGAKEIRELINE